MPADSMAPPVRVLVADDDEETLSFLDAFLSGQGFDVFRARDGEGALAAIRGQRAREQRPIDLVITDVLMPGRSGLELLAGIRALDRTLPVIVISSFMEDQVRERALALGASEVLDKPFDLLELLELVRAHVAV